MPDDTENCSPSEESGCLSASDFDSAVEYRKWAILMVVGYSEFAEHKIAEAEKLVADGIATRELALSALRRAEVIAVALAKAIDSGTLGIEHAEGDQEPGP